MSYKDQAIPDWLHMTREQRKASQWAWENGNLDFMVMPHQEQLWAIICNHVGLQTKYTISDEHKNVLLNTNSMKPLVIEVARRFGKTSLDILAKFALCIKNKNNTYYYTAPNQDDANDIFDDVTPPLLSTCPPSLRPKKKRYSYLFANGSQVKIGGTFRGGEGLRGRAANGFSIDEAGAIPYHGPNSCLTYVLGSVLLPHISTTDGWAMILSTPPADMQHDYYKIVEEAITENRYIKFTINDNSSLSDEKRQEIKEASYSVDPSGAMYDREYLCIARPDEKTLLVPEHVQSNVIITVYNRPQYFEHLHRFIVIDHGTVDLNAILFGYYDYPNAKLIIEKEIVLRNGPSTKVIAKAIETTRKELWGDSKIERAICDSISPQIRVDLNDEFEDLVFQAPMKTILVSGSDNSGREGMVNQLNNAIIDGFVVIDPSCVLLLETIRTGTWKITGGKREFARLPKIGHCDFYAALIYTWRGCHPSRNIDPLVGLGYNPHTQLKLAPIKKQDTKSVLNRVINRTSIRNIFNRN